MKPKKNQQFVIGGKIEPMPTIKDHQLDCRKKADEKMHEIKLMEMLDPDYVNRHLVRD